jgi:CO/xanthine dehydrogenase FAD-binding subunit
LIPALRNEDVRPDYVLNILEIEQLRGIVETDDAVRIGPTTTFREIAESEIMRRSLPLLLQAASWVGGPQIRDRGTIGGNIATASPAADVLPAVLALNGELELQSKASGTRMLLLADAIESPYTSCFRPDEVLTGIRIGKPSPETRSAFEKLGRRNAMARARMNMSVVLRLDKDGIISELSIVPGAVMPVARRVKRVEEILLGKKPKESLIEAAAETLAEEMVGITGVRWSTEYKEPVVKNIFKRVLRRLL